MRPFRELVAFRSGAVATGAFADGAASEGVRRGWLDEKPPFFGDFSSRARRAPAARPTLCIAWMQNVGYVRLGASSRPGPLLDAAVTRPAPGSRALAPPRRRAAARRAHWRASRARVF